MKKMLTIMLTLCLALLLAGCTLLKRPETDYFTLLRQAAANADAELGRRIARERNARLSESELPIDFDELLLLSRYIDSRAGDARLTQEQRLCTGEVMLNRVASPEFPDTLADVLYDAGYAPGTRRPSAAAIDAALELLNGRRLLEPRVVYHSTDKPRGAVYASFCDRYYRRTFFCLTSHPELYESEKP